jgi:3-oxoacyl-[acyl-carrier protein] reductase
MRNIRGGRAVVTGAASGIGRAIALALAREGVDLFLVDIDAPALAAAAAEARTTGVNVLTHACDLAVAEDVANAIATIRSSCGAVNILVNSAGIAYYGATHNMPDAQLERLLAVNLLAPIRLTHALLPLLAQQAEAHIVNVCSIYGLVSMRKAVAYQTSKYGLVGFTMGLRAEYWRRNFGLTALCPGFVRTPLLAKLSDEKQVIPDWICVTPETIAARTLRAIHRNQGLVVVPVSARVLWWLARMLPFALDWAMREGWRNKRRPPI